MQRRGGFTLIELILAVFIAMMMMAIAVPSVQGLLAEQRLRKSFDAFEKIVREAQNRSFAERRAFVIAWDDEGLMVRPDEPLTDEELETGTRIDFGKEDGYALELPSALLTERPNEWIFWPSGTCEPANISYHGANGNWIARYHPLTGRAAFEMQ